MNRISHNTILSIAALGILAVAGVIILISNQTQAIISGGEVDATDIFHPTGWIGDRDDLKFAPSWPDPQSQQSQKLADTCIRIDYSARGPKGWAGIYWQYPEDNWGKLPGYDLKGATELRFMARADQKAKAEFMIGGIDNDSVNPPISTGNKTLTRDWQEFNISLAKEDLRNVIGGFFWTSSRDTNPGGCTIYLKRIRYVY